MDTCNNANAQNQLEHMCSSKLQVEPIAGTGCLGKEEFDGYQNCLSSSSDWVDMSTKLGNVKDEDYEYTFSELEAGDWFHDELVEVAKRGDPLVTDTGAAARQCCRPGDTDGVSLGDPIEGHSLVERKESESLAASSLFAQLKATPINESVMTEAIQRFGGGEEGLRAVVRATMFWMVERKRYLSNCNDSPAVATSNNVVDMPDMGELREISHPLWPNEAQGIVTDEQFSSFLNCDSFVPEGTSCVTMSMLSPTVDSSLWGTGTEAVGWGENSFYGGVSNCEKDQVLQDGTLLGHDGVACWIPPLAASASPRRTAVRNFSISPASNVPDLKSYSQSQCNRAGNKVQKHSTSGTLPLQNSGEGEVPSFKNPHPVHPVSFDSSSCMSSGMQVSVSISENVPLINPGYGMQQGRDDKLWSLRGPASRANVVSGMNASSSENLVRGENSGAQAKQLTDVNLIAMASTKQARKNRIYKKALSHKIRAADGGSVSRRICQFSLPGSPTMPHGLVNAGGHAQILKDPRDLKFLFEKLLRPSDVGSLGRIVLPKKHAESHLPWLEAKAGVKLVFEDYNTGEKMGLQYRYWPNNKSRMYVLENTGEFVTRHRLREFDKMAIYKNQHGLPWVIRARRAGDFADVVLPPAQDEEIVDEVQEITQPSLGRSEGSTSSSVHASMNSLELLLCSGLEVGSEVAVTGATTGVKLKETE